MKLLPIVKNTVLLFCLGTAHAWADTPISSLPITISTPGTYYLTDNLSSADSYGIMVLTTDVTLDLKGYTITGTNAADSKGVWIAQFAHNAIVKNGTIKEFADGIHANSGNHFVTVKNVSLRNNIWGTNLNSLSALVENCTVSENTYGIATAYGTVLNNSVHHNTSLGIYAGLDGARVIGNKVSYNGGDGIKVGSGGFVTNNTSNRNVGDGIKCFTQTCNITGNTVLYNEGDGIDPGTTSLVKDNVARGNIGAGIYFGTSGSGVFDGNVRYSNGSDPSFSTCGGCSLGVNYPQ